MSRHLCAANTIVTPQPTFWLTSSSSSCIDYVCVPKAILSEVRCAKVLHSAGARFQIISTRALLTITPYW